jgi:hypothetical protein
MSAESRAAAMAANMRRFTASARSRAGGAPRRGEREALQQHRRVAGSPGPRGRTTKPRPGSGGTIAATSRPRCGRRCRRGRARPRRARPRSGAPTRRPPRSPRRCWRRSRPWTSDAALCRSGGWRRRGARGLGDDQERRAPRVPPLRSCGPEPASRTARGEGARAGRDGEGDRRGARPAPDSNATPPPGKGPVSAAGGRGVFGSARAAARARRGAGSIGVGRCADAARQPRRRRAPTRQPANQRATHAGTMTAAAARRTPRRGGRGGGPHADSARARGAARASDANRGPAVISAAHRCVHAAQTMRGRRRSTADARTALVRPAPRPTVRPRRLAAIAALRERFLASTRTRWAPPGLREQRAATPAAPALVEGIAAGAAPRARHAGTYGSSRRAARRPTRGGGGALGRRPELDVARRAAIVELLVGASPTPARRSERGGRRGRWPAAAASASAPPPRSASRRAAGARAWAWRRSSRTSCARKRCCTPSPAPRPPRRLLRRGAPARSARAS